jgi:hypothetical protein
MAGHMEVATELTADQTLTDEERAAIRRVLEDRERLIFAATRMVAAVRHAELRATARECRPVLSAIEALEAVLHDVNADG